MPKISNQLNHGESKFNSEHQIKNMKKNNNSIMNNHTLEIPQGLRIFVTCDTVHAAFAFLTFLSLF